jgi:hypothetical protein
MTTHLDRALLNDTDELLSPVVLKYASSSHNSRLAACVNCLRPGLLPLWAALSWYLAVVGAHFQLAPPTVFYNALVVSAVVGTILNVNAYAGRAGAAASSAPNADAAAPGTATSSPSLDGCPAEGTPTIWNNGGSVQMDASNVASAPITRSSFIGWAGRHPFTVLRFYAIPFCVSSYSAGKCTRWRPCLYSVYELPGLQLWPPRDQVPL